MKRNPFRFDACMKKMRHHHASVREDGFHSLVPHAKECLPQLIEEFRKESDTGLRCWLLELIGQANNPVALPLFVEQLRGAEESFWVWAIQGLKRLDTKEARRILWEARSFEFDSPDVTKAFRAELEDALKTNWSWSD